MTPKPNAFGLDRAALGGAVESLGEPEYRGRQLYGWLYRKRARSFDEMTDLSKAFRRSLADAYDLRWPELAERQVSRDGTVKYLFALDGGATIESVYIPDQKRRTICISTQAGCPLKCAFCLTGIAGYRRNLKPAEILGQVAAVMTDAPRQQLAWNVVVMGMGEPLLNYDATVAALRILMDPEGFAVAPRKLTLSTVGILPALEKLMTEPVRPNLAISLHAPDPELRRKLMPIEERYALSDVVAAAQRYPIPRGGLVTYEYVLLGGVNDSPAHARRLARLLRGSRAKVNLIPLNPAPEIPFDPPPPAAVEEFHRILLDSGVPASVRKPRGQDVLAACGQLHLRDAAALTPSASTAPRPQP
ncbi:MAG TPA: 23S rRNA (adenine(2503)-C(2))-methyltransferase RlmN [Vicinamibacteria bacterium]